MNRTTDGIFRRNCRGEIPNWRVNARVKRGQDLIKMLGMQPERISVLTAEASGNGGHPYAAVCAAYSETIKNLGPRTS